MRRHRIVSYAKTSGMCMMLFISIGMLSGCAQKQVAPTVETPRALVTVKTQTVAKSRILAQEYDFPATVVSEREGRVVARTSGTAKNVRIALGQSVRVGDTLLTIDDVDQGGIPSSGRLNAGQIKQAQLGVQQAEVAIQNIKTTMDQNYKSAQIAYDTTKIATEQARVALANRKKLSGEAGFDAQTNATTATDAVISSVGSLTIGINNVLGFDKSSSVDLPYKNDLGAADLQSYENATNAYNSVKDRYAIVTASTSIAIGERVAEAIKLTTLAKNLVEKSRIVVERSVITQRLSQTTLAGFRTMLDAYLAQVNAMLAQLNGAEQALSGTQLNNATAIDALQKAYELAQQQEKNALQSLEGIITTRSTQLKSAELQYQNAIVALQNLYDTHEAVSSINGTVTKKLISEGDAISIGQTLAVISQMDALKLRMYVDRDTLQYLMLDMPVVIRDTDEKSYTGRIVSISPQADETTKRFLVEVRPQDQEKDVFVLGTVMNVIVTVMKHSQDPDSIIVPLSSINIGQNGNSLFIVNGDRAHKVPVVLIKVEGETAEVQAEVKNDDRIIVDGNKLIQDGDQIVIQTE